MTVKVEDLDKLFNLTVELRDQVFGKIRHYTVYRNIWEIIFY